MGVGADTKDALAREMPSAAHCKAALATGLALYGANATRTVFITHRNSIARLFWSLMQDRKAHPIESRAATRLARLPTFAIVLPDRELAERLVWMLRSTGHAPKRTVRKRRDVLYYKDFEAIVDVLTIIGAFGAVLHLEDVRALRETKNRIHRLVNTEAANLDRVAAAAAAQRRVIEYLENAYGLGKLSPPLREIAELRLAHPDESLAELGARCNPPIAKPTVSSRLSALSRLAARLRTGRAS
jgi:hypothetical protein